MEEPDDAETYNLDHPYTKEDALRDMKVVYYKMNLSII